MKSRSCHAALLAASAMLLVGGGAAMLGAATAHAEPSRQESAGEIFDDTVITTKVKAAFFQDETVSSLRINVTSNQGTVQLSGFANSRLEADRAGDVARRVAGVKEVTNDILLR